MRPLLAALATALLVGCGPDPATPEPPAPPPPASVDDDTVLGLASTVDGLQTFTRAVETAGLAEALRDPDQALTVFAPTDAAFAALPAGELDTLLADPARLRRLLEYHVLPSRMFSGDVFGQLSMGTRLGSEVGLDADGEGMVVRSGSGQSARVVTADLDASNGVIHTVDAVLIPPAD